MYVNKFLICFVFIFSHLTALHWRQTTESDLKFLYNMLKSDYPGYANPHDHKFKNLLETSFSNASQKTEIVDSFYDYANVICFFINKFNDPHLKVILDWEKHPVEWPGFVIKYLNGDFFISSKNDKIPLKKLVFWGDFSPELYLKNITMAYKCAGDELPLSGGRNDFASRVLSTSYMGIWSYNKWIKKPKHYTISNNGQLEKIELKWKTIQRKELMQKIKNNLWGKRNKVEIQILKNKLIWVSMPTFSPQAEERNSFKEIEKKIRYNQNAESIVFDLRGNRGGCWQWGIDVLCALFGSEYYNYQVQESFSQFDKGIMWRACDNNLNYIRNAYQRKKSYLSDLYKNWFEKIIEGMNSAIEQNETHYFEKNLTALISASVHTGKRANPVKAKVVVITDPLNCSAAADFIAILSTLTPVVKIGWATNADTNYTDIRVEQFPSNLGKFYFPMKYYVEKIRPVNYKPDYFWQEEIKDISPNNEKFLKIINQQ